MDDVRGRLANRVQLTTDGHGPYLRAVEEAFGADIDFAQLVKLYGEPPSSPEAARRYSPSECVGTRKHMITGNPDPEARQHELHGAAQSDDADEHAPVHSADERILEAGRESLSPADALFRVLQLRAHSQDAADDPGDGRRRVRSTMVNGRHRCAYR